LKPSIHLLEWYELKHLTVQKCKVFVFFSGQGSKRGLAPPQIIIIA